MFVRRILDERRETHDCFQVMPPAPPPPPPLEGADASVRRIDAYRQRLAQGATAAEDLPSEDDATELQNEAFGAQAGVSSLIASLAQDNPALATVLEGAIADLEAARTGTPGRRLFERAVDEDHVRVRDAWVDTDLMRDGPLVGVTLGACGALCEALRRNDSSTDHRDECQGYAYRRLDPSDPTDFGVECHLLYHTGICTPVDFAATMYSRKYTSSGTCKNPTQHENPFCLELPASRDDARVMDHETSHALCARKPDTAPANGGKLPTPRSALEAMSMVGHARQQGIYSFWAEKPPVSRHAVNLHWASSTGASFHYPANE